MMPLRVLLDTSVIRAAVASDRGASYALLRAALRRDITAIASTALLLQYEDVLLRPETLADAAISVAEVTELLDAFCQAFTPVAIDVLWRPQSPDSGDDLVMDAAVNGLADIIATHNLRDLKGPAARFGIAAEPPADVLRRLL